ncbi:unnamed protein product, partial [Rhizopus stolonifer]
YETPHYYINALNIAQRTDDNVDDVDKSEYNFLELLKTRFQEEIPEFIIELYKSFYKEVLVPNQAEIILVKKKKKKTEKPKKEKSTKRKIILLESRIKTMDAFPKRKSKGCISEAAQNAIDKVEKSKIDGKPALKCEGAFIMSTITTKRRRKEKTNKSLTEFYETFSKDYIS